MQDAVREKMLLATHIGSSAATLAILATLISLIALLALHLLSPELDPAWRMVSEYANSRYSWVLKLVFFAWAFSSFALALTLTPVATTWLGIFGILFLFLAGVGEAMGGLFDVNHRLHGVAFGVGVPSLAIAAILLTIAARQAGIQIPIWAASLPILSVLLMVFSMFSFMSSLQSHGIDIANQLKDLTSLPEGINPWNGWANRVLFLAYYVWVVVAAKSFLDATTTSI